MEYSLEEYHKKRLNNIYNKKYSLNDIKKLIDFTLPNNNIDFIKNESSIDKISKELYRANKILSKNITDYLDHTSNLDISNIFDTDKDKILNLKILLDKNILQGGDNIAPIDHPAFDIIQLLIDVIGMIPLIGEIADIINIVVSVLRGIISSEPIYKKVYYINAGLSALNAIPILGNISGFAKIVYNVNKVTKKFRLLQKTIS